MRLGDRLGTLEPGKLDDQIVVDGDPLCQAQQLISDWPVPPGARRQRHSCDRQGDGGDGMGWEPHASTPRPPVVCG